ncbi:hypothetical protein BC835DRAFT_983368 [Cytidiella melzeri]|nr:hypothetical protein BC835DRAFT_983368 [Cytidiella melzeri]
MSMSTTVHPSSHHVHTPTHLSSLNTLDTSRPLSLALATWSANILSIHPSTHLSSSETSVRSRTHTCNNTNIGNPKQLSSLFRAVGLLKDQIFPHISPASRTRMRTRSTLRWDEGQQCAACTLFDNRKSGRSLTVCKRSSLVLPFIQTSQLLAFADTTLPLHHILFSRGSMDGPVSCTLVTVTTLVLFAVRTPGRLPSGLHSRLFGLATRKHLVDFHLKVDHSS